MNSFAKLKFVVSQQRRVLSPTVLRQNKMLAKLDEQIELVRAEGEGLLYRPMTRRWVTNPTTGEREQVQRAKRVKSWYWQAESGKWHLAVRYGSRVLELSKGKNAIEVADLQDVLGALSAIRTAVKAGELDDVLGAASDVMRIKRAR